MEERLASGDDGLDLIVGGGLPINGINLITGLPGSGKTLLCQQFIFAGATAERPAIYFTTVSEPFEKIIRYAQTLSFFDGQAIGRSIFYATPDPVRFREFIYSLTQRLSRKGISPLMTSELPDLFHGGRLAEYGISQLSDNVILLQYLRAEAHLTRSRVRLDLRVQVRPCHFTRSRAAADMTFTGFRHPKRNST
jgi:KaiC/GvpD/RAD55 family RecA-like ATPase